MYFFFLLRRPRTNTFFLDLHSLLRVLDTKREWDPRCADYTWIAKAFQAKPAHFTAKGRSVGEPQASRLFLVCKLSERTRQGTSHSAPSRRRIQAWNVAKCALATLGLQELSAPNFEPEWVKWPLTTLGLQTCIQARNVGKWTLVALDEAAWLFGLNQ